MKTRISSLSRNAQTALFATFALPLAGLVACGDGTTPPESTQTSFVLDATPSSQTANGASVKLSLRTSVGRDPGAGTVSLTATHGLLNGAATASVTLDGLGAASLDYTCDAAKDAQCIGNQTVTANWNGIAQTANVSFVAGGALDAGADTGNAESDGGDGGASAIPATIAYDSLTCGGAACAFLGLKGSSFNEAGTVSFVVKDPAGKPVVNAPVTLTVDNGPSDLSFAASNKTDANGKVTALITSGITIGIFKIHAKVANIAGLEIDSPPIGIRGSKPSNRNVTLTCVKKNIPALVANPPPSDLTVVCNLKLGDRFGNPVGRSLPVSLKAEAGSVPAFVSSTAFSTTGDNVAEGTGSFTYKTTALQLPEDVAPQSNEPSGVLAGVTRNPRDGMVNIFASVSGEEYYDDANANGIYDIGEQFYDQAEPFIDNNDNDVKDVGEYFTDTNQNGQWDGPNGVWDGNTNVWATTWILYTGLNGFGEGALSFSPNTFSIPKTQTFDFQIFGRDENFNQISLIDATYAVTRDFGNKGAFLWSPVAKGDDYGFKVQRTLTLPATSTPCGVAPRCVYKTLFSDWSGGGLGRLQITGASINDSTPADVQRFRAKVQIGAAVVEATMNGTVQ